PATGLKREFPVLKSVGNADNRTEGGGTFMGGGWSSRAFWDGFWEGFGVSTAAQSQLSVPWDGAGLAASFLPGAAADSKSSHAAHSPSSAATAAVAFEALLLFDGVDA